METGVSSSQHEEKAKTNGVPMGGGVAESKSGEHLDSDVWDIQIYLSRLIYRTVDHPYESGVEVFGNQFCVESADGRRLI